MTLSTLRSFPPLVWILIVGVFFTRGSFYMVWPFLAIILYRDFGLNEWQVGFMLTSAALTSVFVGFYSGTLTDKYGRKVMLLLAGVLSVIAFTFMALVSEIYLYGICMALCAISKEVWEPPAKAIMSDLLPDEYVRDMAFQFRYWVVNVGAAIGPLAGVWFGVTAQQSTFLFTASVFVVLIIVIWIAFKKSGLPAHDKNSNEYSLKDTLCVLANDHVFLILILANITIMFVYAHIDSSLVQYLSRSGLPEVVELVSVLIFTNAMTIITFQFPLLRLTAGWSLNARIYLGVALVSVSQLMLAFNPIDWYWGWIVTVFVMSLGETILFPTMNIQIDRLAPKHMKGVYFGAAAFYSIGFAIAPYIGGVFLKTWGGPSLFVFTFALSLLVFLLYKLANTAKRPDFTQSKV